MTSYIFKVILPTLLSDDVPEPHREQRFGPDELSAWMEKPTPVIHFQLLRTRPRAHNITNASSIGHIEEITGSQAAVCTVVKQPCRSRGRFRRGCGDTSPPEAAFCHVCRPGTAAAC